MRLFAIYRPSICIYILLISLLFSCKSYPPIRFTKKLFPTITVKQKIQGKRSKIDDILKRYRLLDVNDKSYPVLTSKINWVHYKRYFAVIYSFSSVVEINNRAVDFALKGMYKEAELLFRETLREDINFLPAYNNLGIIYEMLTHHEKAFYMYSRACIMDPGNDFYRCNFLYFCDNKYTD